MKKISLRYGLLIGSLLTILWPSISLSQNVAVAKYAACDNCIYSISEGLFYDDGGENGPVSNQIQTTTFLAKGKDKNTLSLYFSSIDIPAGSKLIVYYKDILNGKRKSEVFSSLNKSKNIIGEEITIEYIPISNTKQAKGWVGHIKEISASDYIQFKTASQPESDCPFAIPLCTNNTAVVLGGLYEDLGSIDDDAGSCYSGTGEGGSVWYSFTPLTNGPLDFRISPQGSTDYDFVLWDISNGCASNERDEIACNYSLYTGTTGMSGTLCNENVGTCSDNSCSNQSKAAECNRYNGRVNVSSSKKYAICINFYSGSNDGFIIQFQNEQGSVAISDNTPPTITNAYADNCTSATNLHITFSEWVDCSTIQNTDFTLAGHTFTISSTNCTGNKTKSVDIIVSPALTTGTYSINAKNILDLCGNTMNSNYSIILGTPPNPTISEPVPVCKNPGLLGSFSYSPSSQVLTAGGGTAYEWSTGQTTAAITVSPTTTKTYTVKVFKDACSVTASATVIVKQADPVSLGPDKYYCGSPVTLTASPAIQGYTYQFYKSPNLISIGTLIQEGSGNTVAVSPTTTTTYRVILTDQNGCQSIDDIRVVVSNSTNATITIPGNNYCNNANPVILSAVPEGGTFSGPGVSGNIFNPSVSGVGTHTISYSTTNACGTFTGSKNVTVITGNSPNINLNGTYCVNDPDVTFIPTPKCGTFSGPGIDPLLGSGFCFLDNYITSPTFSPSQAGAGTHVITYTPPSGQGYCTNSTTVTVLGQGYEPTISGAGGPYCANAQPITLTGTPTGGVFSGPGISGTTFNPSTAGIGIHTITYTVAVCSSTFSTSVQIEVSSSSPTASLSYQGSPYCASISTQQSITFSGTPGGTYSSSPSGLSIDRSTGAILPSQSSQGTYTVTYTIPASGGCPTFTKTTTVTITNSITPEFNLPEVICQNSVPPQLPATSNNNITGIWNPTTISNTSNGTYTFTPNQGQCSSPVSYEISVTDAPEVDALASETLVDPGTEVQLSVNPEGENISYSWEPAEAVSDPNSPTTTAIVTEDIWFYVTATNRQECSAVDSVLVQVRQSDECRENNIFLPSGFSPNGDGKNDEYLVRSSIPLESMTIMIFNRWGEKVFETSNQETGWDGNYNGKPAAADTYGYYFEGICNGNSITRQGNITIIR